MADEDLTLVQELMLADAQPVTVTACPRNERIAREMRDQEAMWDALGEEDQRNEGDRWDS